MPGSISASWHSPASPMLALSHSHRKGTVKQDEETSWTGQRLQHHRRYHLVLNLSQVINIWSRHGTENDMSPTLTAARDVTCGNPGISLIEASLSAEVIPYHFPCEASEAFGDEVLPTPLGIPPSRWDAMIRPSPSKQGLQRASSHLLLSFCKAALESVKSPLSRNIWIPPSLASGSASALRARRARMLTAALLHSSYTRDPRPASLWYSISPAT